MRPYTFKNYQRDTILNQERAWQRFKRVWYVRLSRWFEKPVVFWSAIILGAVAFFAIGALPLG